ncbi:MAG: adenylylsulfate kinase [Lachnospiraceae bacterium]|nr:adenylylsulfate kinase [Lachnospiraceae bacterium]
MNKEYERPEAHDEIPAKISELISLAESAELSKENGIYQNIPGGDMPGDHININEQAILAAKRLFPLIMEKLVSTVRSNPYGRAVISVSGGSGSGKTCLSALTAWYLNKCNVGTRIISGDNYVHRIPAENDAERLRIFRHNGIRAMVESGQFDNIIFERLQSYQKEQNETGHAKDIDEPWFKTYIEGGKAALDQHLGSSNEQNFEMLNDIISAFKDGAKELWLRRMGRDNTALWYEKADMTDTHVLILEWTHGLSKHLSGIDERIFIRTTPEETYASRIGRSRDENAKTDFIQAVIAIEQTQLTKLIPTADLIINRAGEQLSKDDFIK